MSPEALSRLTVAAFDAFWEGDYDPPLWRDLPDHKRAVFRNIARRVVEAGRELREAGRIGDGVGNPRPTGQLRESDNPSGPVKTTDPGQIRRAP